MPVASSTEEKQKRKSRRVKKDPDAVLLEVMCRVPSVYPYLVRERDWIWIVGAPDEVLRKNDENRKAIKDIGFRFAKRGHPVPDVGVGYWSHSCLRPKPFRRVPDAADQKKGIRPEEDSEQERIRKATEALIRLSAPAQDQT